MEIEDLEKFSKIYLNVGEKKWITIQRLFRKQGNGKDKNE
jgi:hypothetical protein